MAAITLSNVSLDMVTAQYAGQISGLFAGEALFLGAACYVAADGLVYKSNSVAADALAAVHGFTGRAVAIGEPVTLFGIGARFHYAATGLVPGAQCFLSAVTAGQLATAAGAHDAAGIAVCINATDIMVWHLPMVGT